MNKNLYKEVKTLKIGKGVAAKDGPNGISVEIGTCKECKFWEKFGDGPRDYYCSHDKVGVDGDEGMSGYVPDEYPEDALVGMGFDFGGLWLGPDFGCIHWEDKCP